MQRWLAHVDILLTTRLQRDVTAQDIPEDHQKLLEEFQQQETVLKEMSIQEQSYRRAGRSEAAARLGHQMTMMQKHFAEVKAKLEQFKSSSSVEGRIARAMRDLGRVEESACLLELTSLQLDSIQGQFNHCQVF